MEEIYIKDNQGRSRKHVKIICDFCKKEFYKPTRFLTDKNYCSRKCAQKGSSTKILTECDFCKIPIKRSLSKIKSKSGFKFCSRKCKNLAQESDNIRFIAMHPEHFHKLDKKRCDYRKKAFKHYPHRCEICCYNKFIDVLDVHHIDGNRKNSKLENLIILCENCHGEITRGCSILVNRKLVPNKEKVIGSSPASTTIFYE